MLSSIWFYIPFITSLNKENSAWMHLNSSLVLFGIAISFASLQDTSKTSLPFEKHIWNNPKRGRLMIITIGFLVFATFALGVFGYFLHFNTIIKEVSLGLVVLGIGFIGMLKTAVEVFENHSPVRAATPIKQ
jgi:hypothetical protein